MLHLAQVQKKGYLGKAGLHLLATQKSENIWVVNAEEEVILASEANVYSENMLVLVELSNTQQVLSIQNAKDWVVDLVQKFLINGVTPAFLHQETERAEQWRQSLTLQSQELDRRALELEARREQIQSLEEDLKREKKQFESLSQQLESKKQELESLAQQLESKKQELDRSSDPINPPPESDSPKK
ncbi:hypothetical protein ACKFKG_07635 [Phormidesmis sp. 146-35]